MATSLKKTNAAMPKHLTEDDYPKGKHTHMSDAAEY
jgi:hypothetical protein